MPTTQVVSIRAWLRPTSGERRGLGDYLKNFAVFALARAHAWQRQASERVRLSMVEDRLLEDMGLTRQDIASLTNRD